MSKIGAYTYTLIYCTQIYIYSIYACKSDFNLCAYIKMTNCMPSKSHICAQADKN